MLGLLSPRGGILRWIRCGAGFTKVCFGPPGLLESTQPADAGDPGRPRKLPKNHDPDDRAKPYG